eukprot:gene24174-9763_t
MAELAEFTEEGFCASDWINQSIHQRPESASEEPLERFLAELEMRLQLSAEEIEASLQDSSLQAMRRIPFAVQEIYRLQGDIQGMQDQVSALATGVRTDASFASESVTSLAELDRVKINMESARNTLTEATELSGLFIKVEEVFEAGDLPRVAEILSSMRRSLSLGLIEGSLEDALSGQDEGLIQKLCSLLLAVGRYHTVEQLYCASRLQTVHSLWEEVSSSSHGAEGDEGDMLNWLPQFYGRLLLVLEQEAAWCVRVLPSHQHQLTASLAAAVFEKVGKGTSNRLAAPFAPRSATATSIASLTALLRDVSSMGRSLAELLEDLSLQPLPAAPSPSSPPLERQAVMRLLFSPVEEKIAVYGTMEQSLLHTEMLHLLPDDPPATSPDTDGAEATDATVRMLAAASKASFQSLKTSLDRCLALTGGSELLELVRAVDLELTTLISRMQSHVNALRQRQARALSADSSAGGGLTEEEIGSTLRLLLVAAELSDGLNKLEAQFRTTISITVPKLEAIAQGGSTASADPLALRLAGNDKCLQRLQRLFASLQETRFMAFPGAASQVDGFTRDAHAMVNDAILSKVKLHLDGLPDLTEWRKAGAVGPSGSLPSFNAYPLPYVTAVGEYLMTMPQQVSPTVRDSSGRVSDDHATAVLMTEEEGEEEAPAESDAEELAAEWLDKVVSGAAAMYSDQALKIPELSHSGGAQLAADVEYFCNVMSALQVMPPASLLTFQLFAAFEGGAFAEAAHAAKAEGGADAGVLEALALMKKVSS